MGRWDGTWIYTQRGFRNAPVLNFPMSDASEELIKLAGQEFEPYRAVLKDI